MPEFDFDPTNSAPQTAPLPRSKKPPLRTPSATPNKHSNPLLGESTSKLSSMGAWDRPPLRKRTLARRPPRTEANAAVSGPGGTPPRFGRLSATARAKIDSASGPGAEAVAAPGSAAESAAAPDAVSATARSETAAARGTLAAPGSAAAPVAAAESGAAPGAFSGPARTRSVTAPKGRRANASALEAVVAELRSKDSLAEFSEGWGPEEWAQEDELEWEVVNGLPSNGMPSNGVSPGNGVALDRQPGNGAAAGDVSASAIQMQRGLAKTWKGFPGWGVAMKDPFLRGRGFRGCWGLGLPKVRGASGRPLCSGSNGLAGPRASARPLPLLPMPVSMWLTGGIRANIFVF